MAAEETDMWACHVPWARNLGRARPRKIKWNFKYFRSLNKIYIGKFKRNF